MSMIASDRLAAARLAARCNVSVCVYVRLCCQLPPASSANGFDEHSTNESLSKAARYLYHLVAVYWETE